MIIEMNARPGLSIQIANRDGLRWRLRKARGIKVQSDKKGIRLGKDLFGGAIEEDIERISGKDLIGIYEDVVIYDSKRLEAEVTGDNLPSKSNLTEVKTKAKIDTGADSTSIDYDLAIDLGYEKYIKKFEEIKTQYKIDEETMSNKEIKEMSEIINKEFEKMHKRDKNNELPLELETRRIRSSHGSSLRLYVPILLTLGDVTYETLANIYDRSKMSYKIIVGRKSLSRFLVEPSRRV
jgi:hypothetical protein